MVGKQLSLFPEEDYVVQDMGLNRVQIIKEQVQNLSKNIEEKAKEFGEVFTPFSLVSRILDEIPSSYFSDKNKTYFDPCVGNGNFTAIIVEKLMEGLANEFPDVEERYAHIIEKQIFCAEYQESSAKNFLSIFNPEGRYNVNLYIGDSLNAPKGSIPKQKYDVIVGNPPFNDITSTQWIDENAEHKRRSRGKALHLYFLREFVDNASDFFFFIMPAKGWWIGKTHDKNKEKYTQKGLYKIFPSSDYFDIKLIKVSTFCFNKLEKLDLVDCFEKENSYYPVENSLADIFSYSTSKPRNVYEHLLEDEGMYTVYLTTRITKYTSDEHVLNLINDRESYFYRVILNQNSDVNYLGRIKIALPGEYVSGSIVYLKCRSLDEAESLKRYLEEDDKVQEIIKFGRSTHVNTKHFFSLIQKPSYLSQID